MALEPIKPKYCTVAGGRVQFFRLKSGAYRICEPGGDPPAQIGFIWSKAPRTKKRDEPLHFGFRLQPVGDESIADEDYTGDFPRFADAVAYLLRARAR